MINIEFVPLQWTLCCRIWFPSLSHELSKLLSVNYRHENDDGDADDDDDKDGRNAEMVMVMVTHLLSLILLLISSVTLNQLPFSMPAFLSTL